MQDASFGWLLLIQAALCLSVLFVQLAQALKTKTKTDNYVGLVCLAIVFISLYQVSEWQRYFSTT